MPCSSCACEAEASSHDAHNHTESSRIETALLALAGFLALSAEVLAWTTGTDNSLPVAALAILSIACGGRSTLRHAWNSLRTFSLGISFLMALAVIGAIAIGRWPESAMVLFLFEVAERIEEATLANARNSIRSLMKLAPDKTRVREDGEWREIETAGITVGTRILIKPGERVPLDGQIVAGTSALNQAPITGESVPVEKTVGHEIFAGSINGKGALEILVTRVSNDSTLARIVRLVEQAQNEKAPIQRFVDRFARHYTPLVVIGVVFTAIIPPLFFQQPFIQWFHRALVLLVIACPCALVISTPVAIWAGLSAAARRGILIKGGRVLERGRELKAIAFDKTGTLTRGKPEVTDIVALNGLDANQVLHLSASLEAHSEHPLASAIVERWRQNDSGENVWQLSSVENFEALIGRGARGELEGRTYFIGNHRLVHERDACNENVEKHLSRLEGEGKSTLVFGDDAQPLGVFGVADSIREESTSALRALHESGIETMLLTGDNSRAASRIANQTGIADTRSELLPEDKLRILSELQAKYSPRAVGMVGDGINDAPALAKADIGFVMGAAGSDAALEVADVALMDDDLRKIPEFFRLSRTTMRVLAQNVFFAIAIKALFFALALTGHATLWMAVFADVGASLLVVLNSLRLLRRAN